MTSRRPTEGYSGLDADFERPNRRLRTRCSELLPRALDSRCPIRWPLLYGCEDDRSVLSTGLSGAGSQVEELYVLAERRIGTGGGLSALFAVSP